MSRPSADIPAADGSWLAYRPLWRKGVQCDGSPWGWQAVCYSPASEPTTTATRATWQEAGKLARQTYDWLFRGLPREKWTGPVLVLPEQTATLSVLDPEEGP